MVNKLASKGVREAKSAKPKWYQGSGPLLVTGRRTVMRKERLKLSIAAEREEVESCQMEKLKMRRTTFEKIDWETQHDALAKMSKHTH